MIKLLLTVFLAVSFKEIQLENGMKVIMKRDTTHSLASATIIIKSGSIYECDSTRGMTHFLEHLLFNGTFGLKREEIRDNFDLWGTYFNAFTREDFTAYIITSPKEFFELALKNQAQMLMNSIIPYHEFVKEKDVVIQEMIKDMATPQSVALDEFKKFALKDTPYQEPVIGYKETIRNVKWETVYNYYKTFYQPHNMIALILGNFDEERVLRSLKEFYYAPEFFRIPIPRIHLSPLMLTDRELMEKEWPYPSSYLILAFKAPPPSHPLGPACEVLAEFLSNPYESPVLNRVSKSVNFQASYEKYHGLSYFQVFIKTPSREESLETLKILEEIIEKGITIEENSLKRLVNKILSREALNRENITYEGMSLSYWVALGEGMELYEKFYEGMKKLKKEEVLKAFEFVFKPIRYRGVLLYSGDRK